MGTGGVPARFVYYSGTLFYTFRTANAFLDLTLQGQDLADEAVQDVPDDVFWLAYQE